MYKVVLIRHAKSSWEHLSLADYDRPVANRGLRDIKNVSKFLKERAIVPDMVITSGANRAKTTAVEIFKPCGYQNEIVVNDELYFKGVNGVLSIIIGLSNHVKHVFICFHNPAINEIAIDNLGLNEENVPTLGMVFCESTAPSWKEWTFDNTKIVGFVKPKYL